MRKNRNAFFSENNTNFQGYNPMVANAPYQSASFDSQFYSGNMPMPYNMEVNDFSERLAKLERQISRLDHRLSKLEASSTQSTDDFESTTNNMYIL
jgi:hypothetical protein